jgi:hypothetical protein
MAELHSIREFHSQLDLVCSSLESIFKLAGSDFEELEAAAFPAMMRFRELLDLGDKIAGSDQH